MLPELAAWRSTLCVCVMDDDADEDDADDVFVVDDAETSDYILTQKMRSNKSTKSERTQHHHRR